MPSSGTFAFQPSVADIVVYAFGQCQIRRAALTPEHLADARMAANLLLAEWESVLPHLWEIDLYSLPLVQGDPDYALPPETIVALDVYIATPNAGDRILYPVSRSDYAAYPNKLQQGAPTVYWFNRQITPSINFYLTPDGNGPYTAKIWRVKQIQDANLAGAETPDLARRFLPPFAFGLAARLANVYAPQRFDALERLHQQSFMTAKIGDQENAPLSIVPALSSYYR